MDFETTGKEILRSKARVTRMLIMMDIVMGRGSTTTELARSVGITPQGSSEYLHMLMSEGLLTRTDRSYRATIKGVEWLDSTLLSLKGFVDHGIEGLEIIRSTDAVADGPLNKGQRVNLYMKDGLLFAGRGEGTSQGVVDRDSAEGDMVPISELTGVVRIDLLPVLLAEVTPARSGGYGARIEQGRIERMIGGSPGFGSSQAVLAVLDMESAAMLRRSSVRYDLEMPDPRTIADHRRRGRSVVAFGTPHSLAAIETELANEPSPPATLRVASDVPL